MVKSNNILIENRSQEISTITRDLKILAQNTGSPIILLSQLNRNIESRSNKRPLLSDLRESGCIGKTNGPNLKQKVADYLSIEIMKCYRKHYESCDDNYTVASNNKKQYIYHIKHYKESSIRATHNHRLLTEQRWQRIDQIKKMSYCMMKHQTSSAYKLEMILNTLEEIKLVDKENVYDLTLYEYSNFLTHRHIVHNSIEQDADLILMLYQDPEVNTDNKVDIVIAKHRNGPVGSFRLLFHAEICEFANISIKEIDRGW